MEITEVTAYKIGKKVFLTKAEAQKYKYESVDDVQLGDRVVVSLPLFGQMHEKQCYVCCIEGDKIWFTIGMAPPEEYLGTITRGWRNFIVDGKSYSFDIGCHPRKNLLRINPIPPYVNINL